LPFESSPALVLDHKVGFERASNSEELAQQLCSIPGVGPWTEQYVAMRAIGDPDAFPTGDLGLLRGLRLKNARELERRAEVWRTSRAYAAMYIWSR
jgi:3-methyladenine DNA glycosylase/8-oxoguanine DNA glycosylase